VTRKGFHSQAGSRPRTIVQTLYPEVGAGGFSRVDGNIEFFGRVNALISPEMTILDFGAGRGKDAVDDPIAYRKHLRNFRGQVSHVVGVDIDPVVLSNPSVDRAILVEEDGVIPLADGAIDLIFSDFCFEHLRHPDLVARELGRLLKPGGWICARTPNKWGYIGIGAGCVPSRFHVHLADRLQPGRHAEDIFETEYRLNTLKQIRKYFPPTLYDDYSYTYNTEPAYFGESLLATRAARLILSRLPDTFSALLYIFLQKSRTIAAD